jgi:NAD(P)-dependent dehydrogenase (short-subunit alcohol dehydrogenase family)
MKLQNKTAWITGAGSGIGAAIAERLAADGARIIVTDRNADAAAGVASRIRDRGGVATPLTLDVASETDWERCLRDVQTLAGEFHVLVNNAAIDPTGDSIETLSLENWRRSLAVNLDGVFLGTRAGIRAMKHLSPPGGNIINMSSVYGIVGVVNAPDYAAAKGAVKLLTKSAALECCQYGYPIRVNSVHPGFVHTPMLDRGLEKMVNTKFVADAAQGMNAYASLHPMGRVAQPAEIAAAVAFIASDEASFMTGSEFVVDGGFTAR